MPEAETKPDVDTKARRPWSKPKVRQVIMTKTGGMPDSRPGGSFETPLGSSPTGYRVDSS